MADTPSLSEVTNLTVDPERGTGTPAVVFDNREFVRNLNQAANQEAQYKWAKYNKFLELKKDAFKDLQEIQKLPVANQDKELLRKKAQDLYGFIANNPDAFSGKNQAAFDEINGQLSDLLGNATQSKMDRAEDDWNRRYIDANPELNNDVNLEKQQGFWKKPLNERTPYVLDMPVLFDYDKFNTDLMKGSTTSTVESSLVDKLGGPGDEFIQDVTTVSTNRDRFLNGWDNALDFGKDKNGQPYRKYAADLFKKIPEKYQRQFTEQGGDPIKNFWHWKGEQSFGSPTDIISKTKEALKANPNYLDKEKLDLDKRKAAETERDNRQRTAIDWYKATHPTVAASKTAAELLEDYPVQKTQELIDAIGIGTVDFNSLTPEMQSKIKTQVGDDADVVISKVSISNGNINVTTKKEKEAEKVINIKPDDITKNYYDEINKNDAGKESVKRKYFTIGGDNKPTSVTPSTKTTSSGLPVFSN